MFHIRINSAPAIIWTLLMRVCRTAYLRYSFDSQLWSIQYKSTCYPHNDEKKWHADICPLSLDLWMRGNWLNMAWQFGQFQCVTIADADNEMIKL